MFRIKRKHLKIIIIFLILVLSIFIVVRKIYLDNNKIQNIDTEIFDTSYDELSNDNFLESIDNINVNEDDNKIIIDIKGEVYFPGVYEVGENTRIIDAINIAGGLTENANTNNINLSSKVCDEDVIIIYSNNKNSIYYQSDSKQNDNTSNTSNDNNNDVKNNSNNKNNLININTATLEELCSLPGIGEVKASKIIEYRKKIKFKKIEDIMNVSSIGEKLFESIKAYIKV